MKLSQIIAEASLPLWEFSYPEYEHDPTPKVVVLGSYVHPETGKKLLMGVNVRLLDTQKALRLVSMVNDLASIRDGRIRAKYLRTRASQIFDEAYRTYDLSKVTAVEKTTISSKGPDKSKKAEPVVPPTPKAAPEKIKQIPKTPEVPDVEKDLAKGPTDNAKPTAQSTNLAQKKVTLPKPEPLQSTSANDPLSYNKQPTTAQVDNKKSTGEPNVGNTEKVPSQTQRSTGGLDTVSKGSKEKVRQPDSPVPDLEN